jgi:hypothetical protein
MTNHFMKPRVLPSRRTLGLFACGLSLFTWQILTAQDTELTNYKSGIDVIWGGTKGVDYYEEYFYHDKLIDDHKVVYIRSNTPIQMKLNSMNMANYHRFDGGGQIIGVNGKDGVPNSGDEGVIRYKIDRDRQYFFKWAQNTAKTDTARRLPAYVSPFTLASQEFEPGVPVVGSVGSNGQPVTSKLGYYYRGVLDSYGDEWHVLSYAVDDEPFLRLQANFVDQAFYATGGKTVLLVVNPKTPCFTARASGSGQFYTTPPKAYFTPKIVPQTTYISGTVTIELRDINGHNVFYRINGGAYTNAGSNIASLTQDNFNTGANTLEYYYQGNESYVKTRKVVKDPPHPSLSEPHGNYLWVDNAGYNKVVSRLSRAPYSGYFKLYSTRTDFAGLDDWNSKYHLGLRINTGFALKNAFVAKVLGWDYKINSSARPSGQIAKEMILEQGRNIDPIGFELQHSSDSIPNRELHYRGYYDSLPVLSSIFAYDIIVANFRSDQVAGGLTPVEDYFIRDRFAGFAYEAMQWSADMTGLGSPGMWGGARMMTAVSIAMIMREYSSTYYGTSGFGTVQTTYPLCPYENDKLTWKQALFDNTSSTSAYPNYTWTNTPSGLFLNAGDIAGGRPYPLGTWGDKAAYFSSGLMSIHIQIWTQMCKMWGGKDPDNRLSAAFKNANTGNFIGVKDPFPQTPSYHPTLLLMNSYWPTIVADGLAYVQSLPSSDSLSADKSIQDYNIWAFAWYDDQVPNNNVVVKPTITTQPASSTVTVGASVSFSVSASGTAPLTYQWQFNGANIGGATNVTYSIVSASAGNAGNYSAVVTNSAGTATSSNASLTVNALPPPSVAPSITTHPAGATVTAGSNVNFSVTASGTAPLAYQWQFNGAPIAGATTSTYGIVNATVGQAGNYSVIVTNAAGSAGSNNAALTVNALPPPPTSPTITTQPAGATVTAGAPVSFSVTASGTPPLSYKWQFNGSPIGGATAGTYSIFSATAGNAGNYSVVVSNASGSVTSSDAALTVTALPPQTVPPTITTQPSGSAVTTGSSVSFSVTAAGSVPFTYQWRFNGAPIAGASASTYTIASANTGQAGNYSVVITNSAGSVTSSDAVLAVNAPPPQQSDVFAPSDAKVNFK